LNFIITRLLISFKIVIKFDYDFCEYRRCRVVVESEYRKSQVESKYESKCCIAVLEYGRDYQALDSNADLSTSPGLEPSVSDHSIMRVQKPNFCFHCMPYCSKSICI
jgi:hypothetical protein